MGFNTSPTIPRGPPVPTPQTHPLASSMQCEVAAMTHIHGHTLIHSLLASSPSKEIITTNYDQCFEKASRNVGKELSVLPYARKMKCPRWILKMHGCVSHPQDIVITREDYIRYAERRAALAGIVQSLLITKHLLFVGFSLVDDNFFQIISAVKKALIGEEPSAASSGRFGTSLNVVSNPLMEELWSADLDMVTMVDPAFPEAHNGIKECGRRLDIFLDLVTAHQLTDSSHVMENRFDAVLTESEKLFRNKLREFVDGLPDEAKQSTVYTKFEQFMNNLGYDPLRTSFSHY